MAIHRYPCDPTGHVITDDSRVETLTFGSIGLLTGAPDFGVRKCTIQRWCWEAKRGQE